RLRAAGDQRFEDRTGWLERRPRAASMAWDQPTAEERERLKAAWPGPARDPMGRSRPASRARPGAACRRGERNELWSHAHACVTIRCDETEPPISLSALH